MIASRFQNISPPWPDVYYNYVSQYTAATSKCGSRLSMYTRLLHLVCNSVLFKPESITRIQDSEDLIKRLFQAVSNATFDETLEDVSIELSLKFKCILPSLFNLVGYVWPKHFSNISDAVCKCYQPIHLSATEARMCSKCSNLN